MNNLTALQSSFLDDLKAKGRSFNTTKNYKTDLECFSRYYKTISENSDPKGINIAHIVEYNNYLNNKYNSDNSKRRKIQALRLFFDYLVRKSIYPNNPVKKLQTSPKFLDIPKPTPFADIKTIWSHLIEEENSQKDLSKLIVQRNQILILLIFGAGLKVSEISKLETSQIFDGETPRVLIESTNRDPRTVPLPLIFTDVYIKYTKQLAEKKSEQNIEFDNILFNANAYTISSGGLSARGIQVIFDEYEKKLLLQLTPKSLRQACIFKWLQKRFKDAQIKEWLGVTPAYNLKLYKDHSINHAYSDEFLKEMYRNYLESGRLR